MPHRSVVFHLVVQHCTRKNRGGDPTKDREARLYLDIPSEQDPSVDTTLDRIIQKYDHAGLIH